MFLKYLKSRWPIPAALVLFALIFALVLSLYDMPSESVLYAGLLCASCGAFLVALSYTRWLHRCRALEQLRRSICVSDDGLPSPSDYEDELYQELVRTLSSERARLDAIYPSHQGMLAFTSAASYSTVEEILDLAEERGEDPFVVLLDGVEDPHNLGSVIRVCECAGVHGLIIPEHRSAKVNETVMRVSAGVCNHLKIARAVNLAAELDALKEAGLWTAGLEADGEPIWGTDLGGPLALVVGGEGKGIRPLVRRHCDRVVSIPMRGKVNSLNASVACGVAVFEVLRRRTGGK